MGGISASPPKATVGHQEANSSLSAKADKHEVSRLCPLCATLRPEHVQHYRFGSHMFGYFAPPFPEKDRLGLVGFESSYCLLQHGLGVRGSTK